MRCLPVLTALVLPHLKSDDGAGTFSALCDSTPFEYIESALPGARALLSAMSGLLRALVAAKRGGRSWPDERGAPREMAEVRAPSELDPATKFKAVYALAEKCLPWRFAADAATTTQNDRSFCHANGTPHAEARATAQVFVGAVRNHAVLLQREWLGAMAEALRDDAALVATLNAAQRELRELTRGVYIATRIKCKKEPGYEAFALAASELAACVMKPKPHFFPDGGEVDMDGLLHSAARALVPFQTFVMELVAGTRARVMLPPRKTLFRAVEKVALRPNENERADLRWISDWVRATVVCPSFDEMRALVECLLKHCGGTSDDAHSMMFPTTLLDGSNDTHTAVRIVAHKQRWEQATPGGWSDLLLKLSLRVDAEFEHVCELQLSHEQMLLVRTDMGGHQDYSRFRAACELLEMVDALAPDDDELAQHLERENAALRVRLAQLDTERKKAFCSVVGDVKPWGLQGDELAAWFDEQVKCTKKGNKNTPLLNALLGFDGASLLSACDETQKPPWVKLQKGYDGTPLRKKKDVVMGHLGDLNQLFDQYGIGFYGTSYTQPRNHHHSRVGWSRWSHEGRTTMVLRATVYSRVKALALCPPPLWHSAALSLM